MNTLWALVALGKYLWEIDQIHVNPYAVGFFSHVLTIQMPHLPQNKICFCISVVIKARGAMKTKHRVTAAEEIHTQDIFPNFCTQQACESSSAV